MKVLAVATATGLLLIGGAACAEPGLANKVYSPYVKRGMTELELRGGRINGRGLDGESGAVIELEHGFSDRVSLAVLGEVEHHAGEDTKLDAIAVEGVAYLGQIPGLGVDVGAYAEYEQRLHNESGVLEGKLLLAKQLGPFEGRLNLIVEKPLTDRNDEDETEFGYAAEITRAVGARGRLGVQAFGDLGTDEHFGGRQPHYVGPVVKWETRPAGMGGEIEFEAAYLLPVGTARREADGQLRLMVEFEKRF